MPSTNRLQLARDAYRAYESGDRELIESLLADDLVFYSPPDPGIEATSHPPPHPVIPTGLPQPGPGAALRKKGTSPLFDRGTGLASLAAAIALGATSMSDIALLAHLAPVLGDAPSGPAVRRALDLAGAPAMLGKIARARAKARERAGAQ